jgi:xanthine dehydrogenase accessory factor
LTITYPTFEKIRDWLASGRPVVLVEVVKVEGSAPRERGASMAVSDAAFAGTIGGGQLEWLAMNHARKMIEAGGETQLEIPLGPEIGQCCGGRVVLDFRFAEVNDLAALEGEAVNDRSKMNEVLIFGAGHTGLALGAIMALLPVRSVVIDSRAEAIALAGNGVATRLSAMPEALVREAPEGSAFVTMTHEHSLDFLIMAEALKRQDAAYCGMIGSATKRAVFLHWLEDNGYGRSIADRLVCPIGGTVVKDKRPEIIAALTATDILTAFHTAPSGAMT